MGKQVSFGYVCVCVCVFKPSHPVTQVRAKHKKGTQKGDTKGFESDSITQLDWINSGLPAGERQSVCVASR